jgi:hypothetical protein
MKVAARRQTGTNAGDIGRFADSGISAQELWPVHIVARFGRW